MANAKSTRNADGTGPYRRKMAVFTTQPVGSFDDALNRQMSRVEVSEIAQSDAPFRKVLIRHIQMPTMKVMSFIRMLKS